jgi:hypothetical protein
MTTVAAGLFTGARAATTSWGWLSSVVQWFRSTVRSPSEQALLDVIERAANQFGAPVLEARDCGDLEERLDAAVEHPDLFRFNVAIARLLTFDALAQVSDATEMASPTPIDDAIGVGPARIIMQAHPLEIATVSALAQLIALIGLHEVDSQVNELQQRGAQYFYSPDVPSVVLRANFEGLRGGVASLAVAHAILASRRPEPWLALKLAETYKIGLYEYLRLVASIPGIFVAERVVPFSDRFDLNKVSEDHAAALRAMDELVDLAFSQGRSLTLSDSAENA